MYCNDMERVSTQNMRAPYPRHAREIRFDTPDMREFVPQICVEKRLHSQSGEEIGVVSIRGARGNPLVALLPY